MHSYELSWTYTRGVEAISCVCLVQLTGNHSTPTAKGGVLSIEPADGQLSACLAVTARL
jgi:hypothetical protein